MRKLLRCKRGFLLVDAMLALTLLAFLVGGTGGVFALFKQATESHRQAESMVAAKQIAQRYLESWKALPKWYWFAKTADNSSEWKDVNMKNLTALENVSPLNKDSEESGSFKESCLLYKKNVEYTIDSLQVRVKEQPGMTVEDSQLIEFRLCVSWQEGTVKKSWEEEMTCWRSLE